MDILEITEDMLDASNNYIGEIDVSDFAGHIHLAEQLGRVRFRAIAALGRVFAPAGSGIKAGWGIEAGEGIKAGLGIEAGLSISAKVVVSPLRIFAGLVLWRLPTPEEAQVRAGRVEGAIAHGEFVETKGD